MSILCVRIASNNHPSDPSLNALRTQPGDVVEIVDDDHQFSSAERNCGQYRFIQVPAVAQSDLTFLKEHVEDADSVMIARRRRALDITVLNGVAWMGRTSATLAQVSVITVTRTI